MQSASALPVIAVSKFGADGSINPTAALNAAAQSVPDSGGTLELTAGETYDLSGSLVLKSNTILEGNGATLLDAVPVTQDAMGFPLVTNENFNASALDDHNITVDDLNLSYGSVDGGGSHAISFREASDITVENSTFYGGNNATAFLATDDTLITGCTAYGITNCAYDQWAGSSNAVVSNNVAYLVGPNSYGILFTGAGTTPAEQFSAANEVAIGNKIFNAGQAGIWVSALSPDSSVSNVVIYNNDVYGKNAGGAGIGISGAGTTFLVESNVIRGISNNNAIFARPDNGRYPSAADILGNKISATTTSSEAAAIQALGNNDVVADNRASDGDMPALVWVEGDEDVIADNTGPNSKVLSSGATDLTVLSANSPDAPSQLDLAGGYVADNSGKGALVGYVSAIDPNPDSIITYTLTKNPGGLFTINHSTGALKLARSVGAELGASQSLQISVDATNSIGETAQSSFKIAMESSVADAAEQLRSSPASIVGGASGDILLRSGDQARSSSNSDIVKSGGSAATVSASPASMVAGAKATMNFAHDGGASTTFGVPRASVRPRDAGEARPVAGADPVAVPGGQGDREMMVAGHGNSTLTGGEGSAAIYGGVGAHGFGAAAPGSGSGDAELDAFASGTAGGQEAIAGFNEGAGRLVPTDYGAVAADAALSHFRDFSGDPTLTLPYDASLSLGSLSGFARG
ncbi:MAG: right-handed parallel beta-helix repeat-containing protein [Acidisphaera sp.]|nr:right-handed parallel beta-helix repeat-containing protein [Acidisphaera sp.]